MSIELQKPVALGRALRDIAKDEMLEIHVGPDGRWICEAIAFFPMDHAILTAILDDAIVAEPQKPR